MAVLTFYERYRSDTRFKERVDGILMEAIFAAAGVDAEALCKRWESGDHQLKLKEVASKPEPTPEPKPTPKPRKTPTRRPAKRAGAAKGDKG